MKFLYEYRTSDNVHHDGVISAASRDAAFAALRAQGIRPGRLVDAPGFFNKLFGRGKRWIAIGLLTIAVAMALVELTRVNRYAKSIDFRSDRTRRQILGDTAVIEKGIATGWADVFPGEGERFLASFAIPGVPAGLRNTSEKEIREALGREVPAADSDSIEAKQIKAMVGGMKDELREFLASGGSVSQYGRLLVARQDEEIAYYNRAKTEVDTAVESGMSPERVAATWERVNASLRRMGIRLVALPESAR